MNVFQEFSDTHVLEVRMKFIFNSLYKFELCLYVIYSSLKIVKMPNFLKNTQIKILKHFL